MKKVLVIVALLLTSSFGIIKAQTQKLGHINSMELMQMMPGVKEANESLEKYQADLEDALKTMYQEYQTKAADYEAKKNLMNDIVREQKEKELGQMQANIQDFQQTAQDKIQAKKEELLAPISKAAEDAIKTVAKENGYTYIFDTSMGMVIYFPDSNDIMDLVKKKLNIVAATPVTTPATPANKPAPAPAPAAGKK
jgi:outer membrane protein